jgi:hypothetical protein
VIITAIYFTLQEMLTPPSFFCHRRPDVYSPDASVAYTPKAQEKHPLLLLLLRVVAHHPVDAELIGEHTVVVTPEHVGHGHGCVAAS